MIDGFCRQLAVTSALCLAASQQDQPGLNKSGSPDPPDLETITCDQLVTSPQVKDQSKYTDALLRHLNPSRPNLNITLSADFGFAVVDACAPNGADTGTPGVNVADLASKVYRADPKRFGG